jgi:sialate O-acetylesterase
MRIPPRLACLYFCVGLMGTSWLAAEDGYRVEGDVEQLSGDTIVLKPGAQIIFELKGNEAGRISFEIWTPELAKNSSHTAHFLFNYKDEADHDMFMIKGSRELVVLDKRGGGRDVSMSVRGIPTLKNRTGVEWTNAAGETFLVLNQVRSFRMPKKWTEGRFIIRNGGVPAVVIRHPKVTRLPEPPPFSVADFIGDNMVIQRGQPFTFKGRGVPGSVVKLAFLEHNLEGTVDADGNWQIILPAISRYYESETLSLKTESAALAVHNVAVGEVWYCSGQSNMRFSVEESTLGDEYAQAVSNDAIRLFMVPWQFSGEPLDSMPGARWRVATPENVRRFSAVAYLFAEALQKALDAPVGIVQASVGGTRIQAWMSKALHEDLSIEPLVAKNNNVPGVYTREDSSALYNGLVVPALNIPVAGTVWYQGESNAKDGNNYRDWLRAMMAEHRAMRNQPEAPFYIIQLPGYEGGWLKNNRPWWGNLRGAQAEVAGGDASAFLVVTTDQGLRNDIHPPHKTIVAERLSRAVMEHTYGMSEVDGTSPQLIQASRLNGARFELEFSEPLHTSSPITGFEWFRMDHDKSPETLDAEQISPTKIRVSGNSPISQGSLRYNWQNYPVGRLADAAGNPLLPFQWSIPAGEP